jgi:YVTN family beta-propeller protein
MKSPWRNLITLLSIALIASCAEKTIQPQAPWKPILTAPANGAMFFGADSLVALEWQVVSNLPGAYRIQLAHDSSFANPVVDTTYPESVRLETFFKINNLDTGATYYWRVMVISQVGSSEWSDAWHFSIPYKNSVIDTISIGGFCPGLAVAFTGDYLYVADSTSASITVIRTANDSIIATVPSVFKNCYIAASSNGHIYGLGTPNSSLADISKRGVITVIRQSDNAVIDTLTVSGSMNNFNALSPSPNGTYLYAIQKIEGILRVFSTADYSCVDSVTGLTGASAITVSSNGKYVYVSSWGPGGQLIVIDTAGFTIVDTVIAPAVQNQMPQPIRASSFAVPAAGTSMYLAGDAGVWELNTATNSIMKKLTCVSSIGNRNGAITVSPDGKYLYVVLGWRLTMDTPVDASRMYIIETATQVIKGYVSLNFDPTAMVFSADGSRLYCSSSTGKVYVVRPLP